MRILVTGAGGFLGTYLCQRLKQRHDTFGTVHRHAPAATGFTTLTLDICSREAVADAVDQVRPDVIIHAAAITSPDACEKDPEAARAVNITGTQHIADSAARVGCRLLYVSTDMVFDGRRGNYTEDDLPAPVNFYGQTKLEAESLCLESAAPCTVVRITLQYGMGSADTASFSDWIINNLRAGNRVPLFTDQYRTPTYVEDTARGLALAALSAGDTPLFHLAAPDRIDRYDFGQIVASTFNLPARLLEKSKITDAPGTADRPKDVSLNGSKFKVRYKFQPRSVYDGIKAMSLFARPAL